MPVATIVYIALIIFDQVLRENNPSFLEIFMSPSLLLVAYILFLAILLHNYFLYSTPSLHKLSCQEKSTGKTAKIESLNTFVCERALEFLIVLQLKSSISLQ